MSVELHNIRVTGSHRHQEATTEILAQRQKLVDMLAQAAAEAQEKKKLPAIVLPEIYLERPQNPEHGDYASSFPLKLARTARTQPMAIAQELIDLITPVPEVESIMAAPPGFINITLKNDWLTSQLESVLTSGDTFGNIDFGEGKRVQVEFVSSNPTGPLHVGYGRGAVLGSTLANVLKAAGYQVETEYYFNDGGSRVDAFNRSLYARYQQCLGTDAEIPSDGYKGNYMIDLAREIVAEMGNRFTTMPETEALSQLGRIGIDRIMKQIREDIERLGIKFDVWFNEQSLYDNGQYDTVMSILRQGGHLAEKEQATWFISTALGEDKDNVVVRSDGAPTYFATDIAYHYNKFIERKFDKVINIWGADHQGHVPRMKAVVSTLGVDPERLVLIVHQMVTLRRGDEIVRVSTRSGDMVTLHELIEEVGIDACRFFFLSRSANSQMDFDLELAKKESPDNPVYYVQYAHARIASIMRLAEERNIDYSDGDVSLLTTDPELALIREILLLPELIERIARTLEPHHLSYYAQDLATVFHSFYKQCRVVSDDETLTKARLKLVDAAQIVLARTLHLMGLTAPDRM